MVFKIGEKNFNVGVISLKREIEFYEKYRITTEDGIRHREVGGIYKNYTLRLGNIDEDIYDEMMAMFLSENEYTLVSIPDGKNGFIEFKAMFEGISDELLTERKGIRHWDNLNIKFTALAPMGVDK